MLSPTLSDPICFTSFFLTVTLVWTLFLKGSILSTVLGFLTAAMSQFSNLRPPNYFLHSPHISTCPIFSTKTLALFIFARAPIVFQGMPSTRCESSVILSQFRLTQWVAICCWFISVPTTSVDVVSSNVNLEAENGCGCGKLLGKGKVSVWKADHRKMPARQIMVDQAQRQG